MGPRAAPQPFRQAWRPRERLLALAPVAVRRRWFYFRVFRRWLPLGRPVTFSEKMNWRIVRDRRSLLSRTCDKLAMKEFALAHCGDAPLRVPTTYWSGTSIAELADVDLPHDWVLKPNHRFGLVVLGSGTPDLGDLQERTRGWLDEWNWSVLGEWAYRHARRLVIAEERIGDAASLPSDYKVFVFGGVPRLIEVDDDRETSPLRRFYTPDWTPLPHTNRFPLAPSRPAPAELTMLLDIAASIGRGFDFIRVDLYIVDGEVWFGELTAYSGGGLRRFVPPDLDATLGGFWELPAARR